MPARLKYWGFIGLLAVIVAGISEVFVTAPSEPIFNGIRLSEILNDGLLFNYWRGNPTNYPVGRLAQNSIRQKQRVYLLAFHRMGDAVWPVLLNELQAKDSKLKSWLIKWATSQKLVRIKIEPAYERVAIATLATLELGSVPHVIFKTSIDPTWRGLKASSRQKITLDLVKLLSTNPGGRESANICFLLGSIEGNEAVVIPALKQAARGGVPGAQEALKRLQGG